MNVRAYCPFCEKKVTAYTRLAENEVKRALENDGVIEIGHLTDDEHEGDHGWNLIRQEKAILRKAIAEGLPGASAKAR